MQISGRQIDSIFRAVSAQIRAGKAERKEKTGDVARSGDQAIISERASEISKLQEMLAQVPDVRSEKLAQLAELIKSGQYNPPSEQVAEKILLRGLADRLE